MGTFDFDEFGREVKNAATNVAQSAKEFGSEVAESVTAAAGDVKRLKRFAQTGHDLFITGAVTSHGGNMSESNGVNIWITRRDSMLGHLASENISATMWEVCDTDAPCSRELIVHRAMYHGYAQRSNLMPGEFAAAIVHAHTRHTIFRSLIADDIVPIDSEGLYVLGDSIKVYAPRVTIESAEVADMLGRAVYDGANIAVIKGHGPFAIAPTMQEAFKLISCLEASCEILDMYAAYNK